MENTEHYLYAIVVENRIWGELPVCSGNHYEIHAIDKVAGEEERDTVSRYVWEMRCEEAADCSGELHCTNCGEEEGNCECDEPEYEEMQEYSEIVEDNSSARWVKYDPTNIDHVLCTGAERYRDTEERDRILLERKREDKVAEIGRAQSKVNHLMKELEEAQALRDKLQQEYKEIK